MRDNRTVKRLSESKVIEYPRPNHTFIFFQNGETYCVTILTFVLQHNSKKREMKGMAKQPGKPIYVIWLKWSNLRTEKKFFPTAKLSFGKFAAINLHNANTGFTV